MFETPMELHCSQTPCIRSKMKVKFETPMELHCSQTSRLSQVISYTFETPMELHCSQTYSSALQNPDRFETPMELHCSQTQLGTSWFRRLFETPMELHCSQTKNEPCKTSLCLRPLWNYTALKPQVIATAADRSLRPLWNYTALKRTRARWKPFLVWDPYGITLLSNHENWIIHHCQFETPMELHCSQTLLNVLLTIPTFETPMELHCSQTRLL